jgi:RNA polymerase sigma factor (sigma-70 family)
MKHRSTGFMYNEDALIAGCLRAEPKSQQALYELFAGRMLVVCLRYTKNRMEAEDILQEGFLKVFGSLADFRRECPLEAWVKRIMINTALKHIRQGSLVVVTAENPALEYQAGGEEITLSDYSFVELLRLIQQLAPGYQAVFNLYAIEGYNHREIAEILGISEGTSKSQYARARSQMQAWILQSQIPASVKVS